MTNYLVKKLLISLIGFYQKTLSPDHGWFKARYPYGYCRYYPSCSEYAKQSLKTHGVAKGMWLALKRVAKCNPWSEPAADPVPELK